jgi:type I restriction enzyme S subunit
MSGRKEQGRVPALRFPEFGGEWEKKTLGEIGPALMCKRIFKNQTTSKPGGNVPFYKIGTFGKKADAFISAPLYEEYREKYSFPKVGDILISASGTIGRLVVFDGKPSYFQDSNIVWLGNDEDRVTNEFLFFCYGRVRWQASDGGIIKRLYNSDLRQIRIFHPSLPEQRKIAAFLTAIDARLQQLRQRAALLEQYKKGVMQQIFSQEIRFRDEDGGDFPEWEERKLGEVAKVYQPKTISQSDLTETGYLVYGANGAIGYFSQYNHEQSQIAITCRGSTCGRVTFTKPKSWITGNAMVINVDDSMAGIKKFLYHSLTNDNFRYLITGSGQPQITGDIKKHKIHLPCLPEQLKIATFLTAIDQRITDVRTQIERTEDYKRGLLQQMFV